MLKFVVLWLIVGALSCSLVVRFDKRPFTVADGIFLTLLGPGTTIVGIFGIMLNTQTPCLFHCKE